MSKVTEMAKAEAEAAEDEEAAAGEEGEEEDEDEDEPEPGPEPQTPEQQSMEKALRAFEKENTRHAEALRKLLGDDFEAFAECIGCSGVGFAPITAMQFDPELERCGRCQGHGQMLTGSVNEMFVVRDCSDCQGQGFKVKVVAPEPYAPESVPVPRFDPYTGQALPAGVEPYNGGQPGPWAPGYTPPATSAPVVTIGA